MKLKFLLIICCTITPVLTHADTDWTPLLKTLQNSCKNPNTNAKGAMVIPASYSSSIVSNKFLGDSDGHKQTIILKNATAFGAPLKKISIDNQMAGFETKVFFGNNNFMNKIGDFYYQSDDKTHKIIAGKPRHSSKPDEYSEYITNPSGYEYHEVSSDLVMNFDSKNHMISCNGGND